MTAFDLNTAFKECKPPFESKSLHTLHSPSPPSARSITADAAPTLGDAGAGLRRVNDKMISAWRNSGSEPISKG
jgi:hypothetical protein